MENAFLADISANPANRAILSRWRRLQLPDMWLVAGCLFQAVWNLQSGKSPAENVKDYDVFKRFLVKETCVAVRPGQCLAPYGMAGLYAGTLTANPLVPHADLFERKVASYRQRWPWLRPVMSSTEHDAP